MDCFQLLQLVTYSGLVLSVRHHCSKLIFVVFIDVVVVCHQLTLYCHFDDIIMNNISISSQFLLLLNNFHSPLLYQSFLRLRILFCLYQQQPLLFFFNIFSILFVSCMSLKCAFCPSNLDLSYFLSSCYCYILSFCALTFLLSSTFSFHSLTLS